MRLISIRPSMASVLFTPAQAALQCPAQALRVRAGLHARCYADGEWGGLAQMPCSGPAEALLGLAGVHARGRHACAQLAGLASQAAAVGPQREARTAQLLAQRRCLHIDK